MASFSLSTPLSLRSPPSKYSTDAPKATMLAAPIRLPNVSPNFCGIPVCTKRSRRGMTVVAFADGTADAQKDDNKTTREGEAGTDETGGGPPIATIFAGLVVFLLVVWFAGLVMTWVFHLFVR